MALAFSSLGSGSKGNGTLVQARVNDETTLVLVDCGFTVKETERRLQRLGVMAEQLNAIIVTHEHGDHINGVGPLARKYQLPVYMTAGTLRSKKARQLPDVHLVTYDHPFTIQSLRITPVAVPHDACEPAQYIVEHADQRLGILTDLGNISAHVEKHYQSCDALVLEANHDPVMLASGPYPHSLKQRVGGGWGHLNNQQAARFLESVDRQRLQCLVIAHISRQNNSSALVKQVLAAVLAPIRQVIYACQDEGFDWIHLGV